MTENCSSNLNRQDSFNNLIESQFDFSIGERPSTVGSSTPESTNANSVEELKEFVKEIVKKFEVEINTLNNKLKKTNEVNNDLNNKIKDLTLTVVNSDKTVNEIKKEKDELSFKLKQIIEGKIVVYKYVENKWKYIVRECCDNNCVNNDSPTSFCREGNGYIQIKNNTKIVYINCMENGENKLVRIESDNNFNKPNGELSQTFTLYYYEVKLIFEKNEWIFIGLRNDNHIIRLSPNKKFIYYLFQKKIKYIYLPSFNYKTNDIIGCGLVYPPPKLTNKLPYIFFTLNGKQIGKAILLEKDCEYVKPYVWLKHCSIETNFGDNTFIYDVSRHYLIEEFYKKKFK